MALTRAPVLAPATATASQAGVALARVVVRLADVHSKPPFAAKPGAVSGTVLLAARAATVRASYEWEWSGDGGKTWTAVLPKLQAKTEIPGLPAATTVQFRFRAVTKTGAGDWSLPTSLLVKSAGSPRAQAGSPGARAGWPGTRAGSPVTVRPEAS